VNEYTVRTSLDAPRKRLPLDVPIVASTGEPFDLTNEQIYDLIEFP
jgi:hypothetical protein